jgi:hypothetical protein
MAMRRREFIALLGGATAGRLCPGINRGQTLDAQQALAAAGAEKVFAVRRSAGLLPIAGSWLRLSLR